MTLRELRTYQITCDGFLRLGNMMGKPCPERATVLAFDADDAIVRLNGTDNWPSNQWHQDHRGWLCGLAHRGD